MLVVILALAVVAIGPRPAGTRTVGCSSASGGSVGFGVAVRRSPSARRARCCGSGALFASPRKSATSTRPRNTCAKTASKIVEVLGTVHQGDPGQPVQLADQCPGRRRRSPAPTRPPALPGPQRRPIAAGRRNARTARQGRPGRPPGRRGGVRGMAVVTQSPTTHARPAATATSRSSRYLSTDPRVAAAARRIEYRTGQGRAAPAPSR